MITQSLLTYTSSKIIFFFPIFLILIFQISLRGQPNSFTLNFEEGNLRGWHVNGDAFKNQPTFGDNSSIRGAGNSHLKGNWWIGTYENYQGKPNQQKGNVQGDGPTGSLISPTFEIPKGSLSFLIGGGSSQNTRVELCVITGTGEFQSKAIYTASGKNSETMERITWDLNNYAGQNGFINIIDASSGPWGHINVDDFVFSQNILHFPNTTALQIHLVPVPNLNGLQRNNADIKLRASRLELGSVSEEESDRIEGTVINQNPNAGNSVLINSKVDIIIAKPRKVIVPNLVNKTFNDAKALLDNRGLIIRLSGSKESEMEQGRIVSQFPEPGILVGKKSIVEVYTALTIIVNVPELIGLSKEEAVERIRNSRLIPGEITTKKSDKEKDEIISQYPIPGTKVKVREHVNIWISTGKEKIEVPNLIGLSRGEAAKIILQKNLAIGQINQVNENALSGIVLNQDPKTGTMVDSGGKINLRIQKQIYSLILSTNTPSIDSGKAVQLYASINPSNDKVQFEFNYGDGQKSNWTSKPDWEYLYQNPGSYLPYVRAKIDNEIIQSEPIIITINRLADGKPPDNKLTEFLIIIALGGIAAIFYVIRKWFMKPLIKSIDIRVNKDSGIQKIENIKDFNVNLNIRLKPVIDQGKYRIIKN